MSSDNFAIPESAPISGKHCIHITMTHSYLNVMTTLVMGQPMTNETEPSRVTSETSETHVDSQMSDRGICREII